MCFFFFNLKIEGTFWPAIRTGLRWSGNEQRIKNRRIDIEHKEKEQNIGEVLWNFLYFLLLHTKFCFPGGTSGKEPACQCRRHKRRGFNPWVGKIPQRRKWQPTPIFLPGKFHGQRSLVGYSPWGHKESGTTEHTHTHRHIHTKHTPNSTNVIA